MTVPNYTLKDLYQSAISRFPDADLAEDSFKDHMLAEEEEKRKALKEHDIMPEHVESMRNYLTSHGVNTTEAQEFAQKQHETFFGPLD